MIKYVSPWTDDKILPINGRSFPTLTCNLRHAPETSIILFVSSFYHYKSCVKFPDKNGIQQCRNALDFYLVFDFSSNFLLYKCFNLLIY